MQNARIALFFFVATIIGTLSHECGHYLAGMFVGFKPMLHYAYTSYSNTKLPHSAVDTSALPDYERRDKIFLWGGAMQTILTGIAGIIALMLITRRKEIDPYNSKHLFWITIAYFWSRELVRSGGILFTRFFYGRFPGQSDEYKIFAAHPDRLLPAMIILLLLSGLTLTWITFRFVKQHRLQLIGFGALGCIIAYPFWMNWVGPLVLP